MSAAPIARDAAVHPARRAQPPTAQDSAAHEHARPANSALGNVRERASYGGRQEKGALTVAATAGTGPAAANDERDTAPASASARTEYATQPMLDRPLANRTPSQRNHTTHRGATGIMTALQTLDIGGTMDMPTFDYSTAAAVAARGIIMFT